MFAFHRKARKRSIFLGFLGVWNHQKKEFGRRFNWNLKIQYSVMQNKIKQKLSDLLIKSVSSITFRIKKDIYLSFEGLAETIVYYTFFPTAI